MKLVIHSIEGSLGRAGALVVCPAPNTRVEGGDERAELDHLRYVDYKYSLDFRNIVVDSSVKMATVSVVENNEVISVDEDFVVTTLVVCLKRRLKSSLQAQICIY